MRLLPLAVLAACSCPTAPAVKAPVAAQPFDAQSSAMLDHLFEASPASAISLGLHDYDGKLPDRSPAGLAAELAALRADRTALDAIDPATLTEVQRDERGTLLQSLRGRLFEATDLDVFTPTR